MKKQIYLSLFALLLVSSFTFGQSKKDVSKKIVTTNLIDVWDFGAEQLDPAVYNNQLTEAIINGWYTGITAGTSGKNLPNFTAGILTWLGSPTSDRLRTTNLALTRYDVNIASVVGYTGRIYQNGAGSATPSRYLTIILNEDDEVTLITKTDATGTMNFLNIATPASGQADVVPMTSDLVTLKFVAKTAGSYKIYDSSGKPSFFRIYRATANYKTITGTVDVTQGADIPTGYGVIFKNSAGKTWTATAASDNTYSVNVPVGYTYAVSLANANGYVITTTKTVAITTESSSFNLSIKKVDLHTLSGTITGLGTSISKLALLFTPAVSSTYIPEPQINTTTGTYTVQLEANNTYTISATGVNDFSIPDNTIAVATIDATKDIIFVAKPVYPITINAPGLNVYQLAKLSLTFKNLNESGYMYTFAHGSSIALRDGTYSVAASGLNDYPLQLALTSNLKVNGAAASKTLAFNPVTDWSFDDATITSSTKSYKGMHFSGTTSNEITKGHLVMGSTSIVKVPVNPGEKVIVTYYYSANFTIADGTTIITTSGSTSTFETAEYTFPGTVADTVTISNVSGTSYLTDVMVVNTIPYAATITVGVDKNYQSINDALSAARSMIRPNKERVKIMIDPENYEEMLVVDVDSISLINASESPSIALANQGVDIAANAVRITSYYGHGYNYYSMGINQKWNADVLSVNKENGYTNYANTGAGSTNGSYWNATVVVNAAGFQANGIIFENSYNQYISKKESEDVVVEWTSGGKSTRPTTMGSVTVQNKSFVERGAAIAYTKSGDKSILNKCRIVGRQDSFYGAEGARVVVYKGSLMGGTDYIFGGMTLVAYKTDLAMNTSEVSTDVSYITAAQQTTARGFLMYNCKVTSVQPGTETASTYLSKPGQFGRPWAATTSEVVFFNTTIEATNNPDFVGKSLIAPEGWLSTLGGTSSKMYEFGTIELSGENNQAGRAGWSTVLTTPVLTDATDITTFNFTKGTDNWDPIPALIANDPVTGNIVTQYSSSVKVYTIADKLFVSNVKSNTGIDVFGVDGLLYKTFETKVDTNLSLNKGLWIVRVNNDEGNKTVKVLIQ